MLMELQCPSISILFPFLVFVSMLIISITKSKTKTSDFKLPPGPRRLPLIGNIHHLVGSLPHHILRNLANQYGPLIYLKLGEVPTFVVSSAEIAQEVLKTNGVIFAERPYLHASKVFSYDFMDIAFSPYGDYWRQLRKICTTELLSTKRVQSFRSIREEEVMNVVRSISSNEGSKINLSKMIFALTYGITARAAFGKKTRDQEAFKAVVDEAVKLLAGSSISDMYPSVKLLLLFTGLQSKLKQLRIEMDRILENIVLEHKTKKTSQKSGEGEVKEDDLVDVLLRIQKDDGLLTDNGIKAVILDMFSAGSETSSTAVEWAMSEMIKNPHVIKRAQAEVRKVFDKNKTVNETELHKLTYLQSIIKETLRLHPPAPLLVPRENSEHAVISGYDIPAKSKLIVNAWAIGRDPKYWPDAELFKPERFLENDNSIDYRGTHFEYIPFGAGRRVCPGISFAIADIELPLAQLLYHFDWKLPNGLYVEELDMAENSALTVRRKNDLYLIPIRYCPSDVEDRRHK